MKRIADLRLDFEHEGNPRMWTVLIGENGTAKTTIACRSSRAPASW